MPRYYRKSKQNIKNIKNTNTNTKTKYTKYTVPFVAPQDQWSHHYSCRTFWRLLSGPVVENLLIHKESYGMQAPKYLKTGNHTF